MNFNKQTVFTLFIIFMMISWAAGMALRYSIDLSQPSVEIESVYERELTPQEEVGLLRTGRVLIKYFYPLDEGPGEKRALYENFVARFDKLVILETMPVEFYNQTKDEMVAPTGDVIPLANVTGESLLKTYCDNSIIQPRECLLGSMY